MALDRDERSLGTVSPGLDDPYHLSQALTALVASTAVLITGVDVVSLVRLGADGVVTTLAETDELASELESIQTELRQGPLHELTHKATAGFVDLAYDVRWPAYATRAVQLGVRSQLVLELAVPGRTRVVLCLYGRSPCRLAVPSALLDVLVAQAGLAVAYAGSLDQLNEALRSRKVIGQALGLVMGQYTMSEEQAFAYLRRISQHQNIKLRDVCADLVASHAVRRADPRSGVSAPD